MKSVAIIVYGVFVVLGTLALLRFANAFTGWGDGATVAHRASVWAVTPIAVFFLILAVCAWATDKKAFLLLAHGLLIFGLIVLAGVSNGLVLLIATLLVSWPMIALAAGDVGESESDQPNEEERRDRQKDS